MNRSCFVVRYLNNCTDEKYRVGPTTTIDMRKLENNVFFSSRPCHARLLSDGCRIGGVHVYGYNNMIKLWL